MRNAGAINILLEGAQLGVRRAGLFRYRTGYQYPRRQFQDYDLILIARGKAHWQIDGLGRKAVGPGTIMLFPPGLGNGTAGLAAGAAEHVGIHFDLSAQGGTDLFEAVPFEPVIQVRRWRSLYAQAVRIAAEWSGEESLGRKVLVHDLTRCLLIELIRQYARTSQRAVAADARVLEIMARIEREFASPLTVTQMARWGGLSSSHLRSLFHSQLGFSPVHALLSRRMREARRLLSGSTLPMKEISHRVGFDDPLYFSRAFRRLTGMTPSEYRQSASTP